MSKATLIVLGTVFVLGACAKHRAAPVAEPVAPVFVEPVSTKGKGH